MSREATPQTCETCGTQILTTNWDPIEHMPTPHTWKADPTPLTQQLETICILTDRPTYNHYQTGNTHQLALRDTHWHKYHHRGHPRHVFPAHQCGTTLPGIPINLTSVSKELDPEAPIPF